jgi:uncharacterized protein YbgA (DUF1722 family)
MKAQEYEKSKLMTKIEDKMLKAQHIKEEREQLIHQRGEMKKEIEKQKRDMFEKIEKFKQGKLDPNELQKSLSMDSSQRVSITKTEKVKVKHHNERSTE